MRQGDLAVTETTTVIDDLKRKKELIWDALLSAKYDSPEGKKLEQQYVDICRKIRRLENP